MAPADRVALGLTYYVAEIWGVRLNYIGEIYVFTTYHRGSWAKIAAMSLYSIIYYLHYRKRVTHIKRNKICLEIPSHSGLFKINKIWLDGTWSHLKVASFIFKDIQWSTTSLYTVDTVSKAVDIINGNHKKSICKFQATFCLRQGPLHSLSIPYSSPFTHHTPTYSGSSEHVLRYFTIPCKWWLRTVLLWQLYMFWAQCTIQRTHAKKVTSCQKAKCFFSPTFIYVQCACTREIS